ncbi:GLPGLI family protein [Sphingobacterium sp. HMA12]|jgi:GLPGLI family protein|uniref:GLPGLI family protein n=1 Tax=Sphingobacterium sp. HMA12 TaxID=2050894 RepID=UPI000CEA3C3C|nr:GLPGLI family protein [Sphingobacterium sp. HMA12]
MRTIKNTITLFLVLFLGKVAMGQYAYFPDRGTITFEKTVFLKNLIKRYAAYSKDEESRNAFKGLGDAAPENQVLRKTLKFSPNEVLYEHIVEDYPEVTQGLMQMGIFESGISSYQNLKTKEFKSTFELGGERIVIADSTLRIKWKITNEYREIAGYQCRRANGLVLDSIYAVAFYTDQIPVSGGPSAFNGLPGMILGLAVPELHYNMFATKVELSPVTISSAEFLKKKDKPLNRKQVYDKLNAVVGDYLGVKVYNLVMGCYYL